MKCRAVDPSQCRYHGKRLAAPPVFSEEHAKFWPTLTQEQKYIVADWVQDNGFYGRTNHVLRYDQDDVPRIQKRLDLLDSVVQRPLSRPVTVYRGIEGNPATLRNLRPGDAYQDAGYMATSSDVGIAYHFASGYILRIQTSEGAPISEQEHEYLLPRGKKFKVASKKKVVHTRGDGVVQRLTFISLVEA